MANVDLPIGLRPHGGFGSGAYNAGTMTFFMAAADSTACHIGSPVKLSGTADPTGRYASVTSDVSAGDIVIGVMVGIEAPTQDATLYRVASTDRYVRVAVDPQQLFECQEDSVGSNLAITDVGLNVALTGFGTGNNTTGFSSVEIDSSSAATTAGLDAKLIGLVPQVGNDIGANANWLVLLQNHTFAGTKVGV